MSVRIRERRGGLLSHSLSRRRRCTGSPRRRYRQLCVGVYDEGPQCSGVASHRAACVRRPRKESVDERMCAVARATVRCRRRFARARLASTNEGTDGASVGMYVIRVYVSRCI